MPDAHSLINFIPEHLELAAPLTNLQCSRYLPVPPRPHKPLMVQSSHCPLPSVLHRLRVFLHQAHLQRTHAGFVLTLWR